MIKAVLFDLDGTLVDTEPLHLVAFNYALSEFGIQIGEAEYFERLIGYDDRGCFQVVLREQGLSAGEDVLARLIANKSDHYVHMIKSRDLLYEGAAEFVRRCAARFPLMIVTGTLRAEAELILTRAGLRKLFVDLITADEIEQGKPAPDGFLAALGRLGFMLRWRPPIESHQCLVIEDTPAGVEAGKRAGMRVLAVAQTTAPQNLAGADLIRGSLAATDLDEVLRQLKSG